MQITKITASTPFLLSKQFSLSPSGDLIKQSAGQLLEGAFNVLYCQSMLDFARFLPTLQANQALCYGRPIDDSGRILSKQLKTERNDQGAITRSRQHFNWPEGPAIFFGDYDAPPGQNALTPEELRAIICRIIPKLNHAPMVLWHSASSHIYHKQTGEALKGRGGIRLYIQVADGRDISRFGKILYDRLWLNGYGYCVCSKAGQLLKRTFLDDAVWQPERLDFAAGAYIAANELIEQRRPEPLVFNPGAPPFNTAAIADLSEGDTAQCNKIQRQECAKLLSDQQLIRKQYLNERLQSIANEETRTHKRKVLEAALEKNRLFADFELITQDGQTITVGKILANRDKFHNTYTKDPLEPEYHDSADVGWLNLNSGGKPFLYSHAHGGATYTLMPQKTLLPLLSGELPQTLRETAAIIPRNGEVYQRGGMLVRIVDSDIIEVTPIWLKNHIEESIVFQKWDARRKELRPADAPEDLAKRYIHNRGAWFEQELKGVINAPLFRQDGSLLSSPGYDKRTGLLLRCHGQLLFPDIPLKPSMAQVICAFKTLWEPVRYFPFVTPEDAAGALAAMLTAIQRQVLPTAPAFGFNAHVAGSGKSYLAKTISWLNGIEPCEMPWTKDPEEQRKRLTAALLKGHPSILIDNVNGALDSDTLCSILTSERFEDRRLGASENLSLSTRTQILVTGNNLSIRNDLCRRVILTTIDHAQEKPALIQFPFNPVTRMRENWQACRVAGLTLLSGFIAAGSPQVSRDTLGSFEVWDASIRQCVLWLAMQLNHDASVPKLGDPLKLLEKSRAIDPETERLEQFLEEWHNAYLVEEKTVAEVIRETASPFPPESGSRISQELLSDISGGREPNSRAIAAFLRRHEGAIVGNYCIKRGRSKGTRVSWFVEKHIP